jgi:hypothetical protein
VPHYALDAGAQTYPFTYANDEAPDFARALIRYHAGAEVSHAAVRCLPATEPTGTMALLEAMTSSIKSDFAYVRRPEKGVQRPEHTLRRRSGSCRRHRQVAA